MMAVFTVTVDDKDAQAMLARIAQVAGGSEKVLKKVALAAKQEVYNAFRFQRAPDGSDWPALKAATLRARARKGNHSLQPLIATGKMYASIEAENTATEAVVSVGGGLPDARAWYNQFGTLKSPSRAFLPITTTGVAQPTAQWLDAVMAPIRKALEEASA